MFRTRRIRRLTAAPPAGSTESRDLPRQRLAVPAYAYPHPNDWYWVQLVAAAPAVSLVVIDPSDGPGASVDPNYSRVVDAAHQAGITVLGYMTLAYARRSPAEIGL